MRSEENRVLVVAPVGQDAEAMAAMLRGEGVMAEACAGAGECLERLEAGAGALLLTEEALELPGAEELLEGFRRQPAWSELPLIILTSGGESRFERLLEVAAEVAGMVILLERPMREGTLVRAVQVALRSRRRQYQVRDLMAERERAAEALRRSEEQFRTLADSIPTLAWWANGDGYITWYNHRWYEYTGKTHEQMEGWGWQSVHDPEMLPLVLERWRGSIATGEPFEMEFPLRGADGRFRWFLTRVMPVKDKRGKVLRWFGTNTDITEMRAKEAAVRESEERLRTIMDTAQVGILVAHDPECLRVTGNSAAHRILGVPVGGNLSGTPEAPVSVSWRAVSGGRELAGEELPMQQAARTNRIIRDMELEVIQATGEQGAIVATAAPLRDAAGAITGVVGTLLDITERKRAEEALRQANERLSYHVQNTPLAVVEFDAELKVCAWSGGAERMFGWRAAEVLGRSMWEIGWICEEDRGKVKQVSSGLEGGQTARSVSPNRNLRKDGEVIWCEWYNSSITDDSGKMQSILSLVLDVTKRQEAEAVLARDKEQLERLVAERTAELRELVAELEHFSYSITHDMRAPLRAMMGFAEVVKELCSGSEHREEQVFLKRIQTAARRMDLLITDALNYSKAVRSELPVAPMDVGRLLREMVDTYPELQEAQGGIRIEPELPLVMGNEAGLTQCFSNLLVNAVKFAKPGVAPQIRVWGEEGKSEFRGQKSEENPFENRGGKPESGWVRIWVEDDGIGIGPSMLPRVFDMFSRGTSEQAGTGIGLALVRKVVERMGGRVGVESELGRGSRFRVELRSGDLRWRSGG